MAWLSCHLASPVPCWSKKLKHKKSKNHMVVSEHYNVIEVMTSGLGLNTSCKSLRYLLAVIKTLRMLNRKITKPSQSQYFRAKPTNRKTTLKREESEKMLALFAGYRCWILSLMSRSIPTGYIPPGSPQGLVRVSRFDFWKLSRGREFDKDWDFVKNESEVSKK